MRAKCNDDLSTVNFSTIGLDIHKNRPWGALFMFITTPKDARFTKRSTSNRPAHTLVDNALSNGVLHRMPT